MISMEAIIDRLLILQPRFVLERSPGKNLWADAVLQLRGQFSTPSETPTGEQEIKDILAIVDLVKPEFKLPVMANLLSLHSHPRYQRVVLDVLQRTDFDGQCLRMRCCELLC